MNNKKIIFMGSPKIASDYLEALIENNFKNMTGQYNMLETQINSDCKNAGSRNRYFYNRKF